MYYYFRFGRDGLVRTLTARWDCVCECTLLLFVVFLGYPRRSRTSWDCVLKCIPILVCSDGLLTRTIAGHVEL